MTTPNRPAGLWFSGLRWIGTLRLRMPDALTHTAPNVPGEWGEDIHTIHELLGPKDGSTTMIYTHVLNRGPLGVRSPADLV
jgi:integrase